MKLFMLEKCPFCYKAALVAHVVSDDVELVNGENLDHAFFKSIGLKRQFPLLLNKDNVYMLESMRIIDYLEDASAKPLNYAPDIYPSNRIYDLHTAVFPYFRNYIQYYQKVYFEASFNHVYGDTNVFNGPGVKLDQGKYLTDQLEQIIVGDGYITRDTIRKEDIHIYPDIRILHAGQAISPFKLGERTLQYFEEINDICGFKPYMIKKPE
jgi:glutaredoxin 2